AIETALGVGTPGEIGTVVVSEAGGTTTITITFNDSADLESFSSSFTLDAPVEDSDADLSATITAYAKDKTDATETGDGGETKTIVVDAVLDRFADVEGGAAASGTESDTVQNLNLGLGMQFAASGFTPTDSTPDDTDGSETFTITVTLHGTAVTAGVGLVLGAGAPSDATLTEGPDGTWTLNVSDPADLEVAVGLIEAVVPAGYEGTINGSISSVSEETLPNNDEEDTLADNRKEDSADFSLTIEGGEVVPTAAFGDGEFAGIIKEDSVDNTINFSAASGDSTDELTSVVITLPGVTNGDVDVTDIETALGVGTPGEIGTVVVSEAGGTTTITITFNDSADLESFSSSFTLDAPVEDSDADLSATITAYAKDKTDATETGDGGETKTIVVDAVLDRFADVEGGAAASGTESDTVQNLNLGLGMQFAASGFTPTDSTPDDTDGSETFEITVTLHGTAVTAGVGLTLGTGAPNGATLTETSPGSGVWKLGGVSAADLEDAIEAIEAVVPAGYEGTINGSISSLSEETEPNADEEDTLADNSKEDSADFSLTIEGGEVVPTAAFGDGEFAGIIKEDSDDNVINFSAASGDSTDELTRVVITLPGVGAGDVDVSAITADLAGDGTVAVGVDPVTGATTITIIFNNSADLESFSSSFTLDAPVEDSDADLSATITAYAKDKTDATETGNGGETKTIVVDAVLDYAVNVGGDAAISVVQANNDPIDIGDLSAVLNPAGFANSTTNGTDFGGADGDGSELVTMVVEVNQGASLGWTLPAGISVSGTGPWTFTGTTEDIAGWNSLVDSFNVTTTPGFNGDVTVSIKTTTEEANTPDGTVVGSGVEDDIADNTSEENVHTVTISVSSDTAGGSVGGTRSVAEDNDANQDDTGRVSADQQVSIAVGDVFTPADNEEVTGATLTFSGVTVTINGVAITSGTALTTTQLAAWNAGTGIEVTVDADSDEDVSIDFDIDFVDPDSGQTGNATGDFVIEVDAVADLPTGTEMGIATNGVAYFIAGSSGGNNTTLYSVDLDSSNPDIAPTAIGTINYMIGASSYSSSDFEALGSADGYLYGITTSGHVVTLDPSTVDGSGNVTVVNAFDLSLGDVISDQAGATYANGQFYVISTSGNTSQMFAVDPTTGAATNIATLSGTKVDGLAYDTANNQFWTVVNDGAHTYAYKMTVSGGTITLSNQIEIPGNPDIQSIAYGTNGKIWVIERTNPGNVFEIDPDTSTLTSTFTIDNSDVSSSGIENLTITTSTGTNVDSGEQFGVTLKGTFGDVTDGSEVHYFLVEVPAGFTAQNPALLVTYSGGNGPDGIPDGTYIKVDADALMIGNTAIGNAVLIAPENMPSDTNFDIKVYTVAEETNLAGDEESDLTNNVAVTEDTVTITVEAASNTLNMAFAVREMALDVVGSDPNSDAELSEQSFGVNHQANNFKWDGDVEITINGETKSLSDLTSHGTPIDITVENGGHKLVGSTPAGEVFVLTLKPGTSGDYEFELKGPIDHPAVDADGGDDVITLGVSYSSNTHDGVVSIDIVDDVPAAVNHQHTGEISLPDYNVAISIDISTSMDDRHDGTNTRLDTAKAAAIELATELFAAGGDVSISLSVFADGGFVIGQFTDLASFMDAVDDIDFSNSSWAQQQGVSGGTNYNDAVNGMRTGLETFFAGDQAPGTQKLAYFLSDGKHNEDSFNSSSWQNFVAANGVKSYAVAIGGDINNPTSDNDLRGVSYDPENPGSSSANILVVDDPSELAATLTDTILDVVSGNIFDGTAGGHYGADGAGGIVDITVFGNTYDVNSPEVTGTVLEATDANGNLFTFDFDTGSYEFRVDDTVSGVDTTISYTLEDWDGDQAVGTIDIDVDVVPNAPAAYDNAAYVEQSGMGNVSVVLEDFSDNSGWDEFGDGGLSGGEGEVSTNWWGGAMSPESLESNLGLPTGTIEGISGLNNVDEGSAIVIDTFAATTGDTVTFDWSFDQSNFGPADGSFYILKNMDTGALTTGTLRVGSDGSGQQTLTIPSSGSYQVILGVVDMNNGNGISTLNVDNVVLNTTGLVEKVVTGNVLSDPMNDAASDDWWGATDFVEYGTELTSVEHDGTVYTLVNGTVTFTTVLGGTFEINADGSYSYAAPDNVSGVEEEVFTYTLTDISGDTDTANLTVHVGEDASHMPLNWTGTSVADLMHGTANDDVLVGMAGDDTLYGEGGDDYIVGGAGDDTLFGGDGADRFVYQSANDGEDVIKDFDMTEGDQVNLDALFDSLGIVGAENRANMVEITDNGGNQELTIDGVSDFKIVFENFSDLTASGTEPFSETDLQNMKIVVDES
ncbi:type I secretion C-terminal target domain-containing protein, partial [Sneathiella chinensis]